MSRHDPTGLAILSGAIGVVAAIVLVAPMGVLPSFGVPVVPLEGAKDESLLFEPVRETFRVAPSFLIVALCGAGATAIFCLFGDNPYGLGRLYVQSGVGAVMIFAGATLWLLSSYVCPSADRLLPAYAEPNAWICTWEQTGACAVWMVVIGSLLIWVARSGHLVR